VSLDGFAAGPNGELDKLVAPDPAVNDDQLRFLATVDTMLLGAKTYRMFAAAWPEASSDEQPVAPTINQLNKVVFSGTLHQAPWGRFSEGRIVRRPAVEEVADLRRGAGKDMVVWGSLSIARALLAARLVDVLQLWVSPVLLGSGRRLFDDTTFRRLEREAAREYDSGMMWLTYRVAS
jgi:dihydrofolate reductase